MKTLLTKITVCLASLTAFGQHTQKHHVTFYDIDGFSGYVEFTTQYIGFATQLAADNGTLVLEEYDADEESLAALKKAGYDLYGYPESGVTPNHNYGYEVTGNAYVSTYAALREAPVSSLHINRDLGERMETPDFPKDVVDAIRKDNLWEKSGGFRNEKVVKLYISDFKNEIQRIIYDAKKEKEAAEQKEKEQKEAQEKAKKEQEEKEKAEQEAEAKEKEATLGSITASSGGGSKEENQREDSEEEDKEETADKKSSKTVYHPKSNRQLYDELKAMTDAHPEMLNDPKIRVRLNGYKAMADRDDRNMRDYQSFKMITGGGYHPQTSAALSSIYQTNANIANVEMAVGGAVDVATGIVNSIVEASNRKTEQGWAEENRKKDAAMAKKNAIAKWENELRENRFDYERETRKNIEENYKLVATINDLPITYETEAYKEGKPYWKGQVSITPREFVKTTKTMDRSYNLYIVELDGLYGILGDDGEALYPPQFEGIYAFNDPGKRPRFLVNIKDKWGEIMADGSIAEEIKYDGIWYTANKESKILKQGDSWQLKALDDNRLLKQFNTAQISNFYAGGLIPVSNSNTKGFNEKSGSYSLAADGKLYVWGESKEQGVASIAYEMAKKDEVTERLFKMNNKWFITSDFGTKDMKIEAMPTTFVIPILRDKKWGAINQERKIVIPFENSYIRYSGNQFETDKGTYNADGILAANNETELKNVERKYYNNGNLKSIGAYDASGYATGTWKYYHENGKLEKTGNYKNGNPDGEWVFYYNDGQAVKFKSTLPEGPITFYYKSGVIEGKGQRNTNGMSGYFIYYYENGNVKSEGLYENSEESGKWKYYYENGKIQAIGKFKEGEKQGEWRYYDENGSER